MDNSPSSHIDAAKIQIGGDEWNSYVESIYKVLPDMQVPLDSNPLEFGPGELNRKIAACRNFLDRCDKIFLTLSEALHFAKKARRKSVDSFDLSVMELRAHDPEVRAGRSDKEREAIATMKLLDERREIMRLDAVIEDLTAVIIVVKSTKGDLKDTRGRIKDQMVLCQEEIALGQHWGARRKGAPSLHGGQGLVTLPEPENLIKIGDILEEGNSLFFRDKEEGPPPSIGITKVEPSVTLDHKQDVEVASKAVSFDLPATSATTQDVKLFLESSALDVPDEPSGDEDEDISQLISTFWN